MRPFRKTRDKRHDHPNTRFALYDVVRIRSGRGPRTERLDGLEGVIVGVTLERSASYIVALRESGATWQLEEGDLQATGQRSEPLPQVALMSADTLAS